MIQGTGSEVGKSLLVAGLGRAFARRGLKVRPFKPQNMSNNAAVAPDGGEIGRAQALQARACGVVPSLHMNPILLKPQSETGAQIVIQGRVAGQASARDYHALKPRLLPRVLESFAHVAAGADLVLIEGAGSAAEVNLRASDIANMGFAEAAGVPVVLVGDIDRGGVIASLVGTWALLSSPERARLEGYIVNKFRGDAALFAPAVETIGARTGLTCLGLVPFFPEARRLPAEDGMALDSAPWRAREEPTGRARLIRIAVPRLPRIANFDDLDPLAAEPGVVLHLVEAGRPIPQDCDLVILPGSKSTIADLAFLRTQGWDIDLLAFARAGGRIVGLCGGYQMLGARIRDPLGIEGEARDAAGLGLLAVETTLSARKALRMVAGTEAASGAAIRGYEIHMGETAGADCARPWFRIADGEDLRPDGACSPDGRIRGTYIHGLFGADAFRRAFLEEVGGAQRGPSESHEAQIEQTLDAWAAHLAAHIDLDRLLEIARAR